MDSSHRSEVRESVLVGLPEECWSRTGDAVTYTYPAVAAATPPNASSNAALERLHRSKLPRRRVPGTRGRAWRPGPPLRASPHATGSIRASRRGPAGSSAGGFDGV